MSGPKFHVKSFSDISLEAVDVDLFVGQDEK